MALDDPQARPSEPPHVDGPRTSPNDAGMSIDADVPPFAGDEVLPCGRLLSRVWEQTRDRAPVADPHTASCPHCREAVEGLATVNTAAQALRAEDPPGLQALADRVMNVVRAEIRLGRLLPLADPDRELRIAESAAAPLTPLVFIWPRRAVTVVFIDIPFRRACGCTRVSPSTLQVLPRPRCPLVATSVVRAWSTSESSPARTKLRCVWHKRCPICGAQRTHHSAVHDGLRPVLHNLSI